MTLLTQREAASFLRLSERTLERMRVSGLGPKYARVGRSIRYNQLEIEDWIVRQMVSSTSEQLEG